MEPRAYPHTLYISNK